MKFDLKDQLIEKIETLYDKFKEEYNKQYEALFHVDEIVDRFQPYLENPTGELTEFFKHSN